MSALTEASKQSIQALYSDFLRARNLKPRLGQKQMIAEVASILSRIHQDGDPPIGLIEAGTGTGKTLAYLVGALPVALEREMPLLISTATVSLQTQLIEKDLPDLVEATDLMLTWSLAKGRRRYLCPIRLEAALDTVSGQDAIYPDELTLVLDSDDRHLVEGLSRAWVDGSWRGDMDQIPEVITDAVRLAVTTDHRRCQGRQCQSFSVCPYFLARDSWLESDVLIVNHDLLMADLKLGGGVILPPLEKTILVIDEAHQLARVAADQFTSQIRIAQSLGAIKSLDRVLGTLAGVLPQSHRLRSDLARLPESLNGLGHQLADWGKLTLAKMRDLDERDFSHQQGGSRYRLGLDDVFPWPTDGHEPVQQTLNKVQKILDWLKGVSANGSDELSEHDAEMLAAQVALSMGRLESIPKVTVAMSEGTAEQGDARWIRVGQDVRYATPDDPTDIEFWVSPIAPADALRDDLWGRVGAAILTSATLAHQHDFKAPVEALGLPHSSGLIVAGAFDYARQGVLRVPAQAGDPRDEEAHATRISEYLNSRVDSGLGVLVLFTSWRLLFRVEERINQALREQLLVQGQLPLSELLSAHQKKRLTGQTSVIFGLQSMAEGLDLPGDLANEVVITRLPFQPPDDPREATFAEYLKRQGRDAFAELSMPAATIRLRQAVGRLIRSETDTGQITVLDRRLVNTRWGRTLLQELPAFQLEEQ